MSKYKHLKECSIASQKKEIAESYAKIYSKRMPRDKKPLLTFNFKITPRPKPKIIFAPGVQFIQDFGKNYQKTITLKEKNPTWQDDRWEDTNGGAWTEGYLKEQFELGGYKYLG